LSFSLVLPENHTVPHLEAMVIGTTHQSECPSDYPKALANPIRVLVVDDHEIVLRGLKTVLDREGFEIVGEASDGSQAVARAVELQPDLVVMDISMPVMTGIEAAAQIRRSLPSAKVVLLTVHTENRYILEALRSGIRGYVLKSRAASELVEAIHEILNGRVYLSPGISQTVVEAYLRQNNGDSEMLTRRELQVLQLVAEGKTTKEIAASLDVSAKTADSHRSNIMHKLNLHSVADLVRYAIRRGLVQP
jgi:two-component system, NarL family, response regulator NreC